MGWRDLLQAPDERLTAPWLGGRVLRRDEREWHINGRLPVDYGWYEFQLKGREAKLLSPAEPGQLKYKTYGYLIGDRLAPDQVAIPPDIRTIGEFTEQVSLVDPGLDRFVRVSAGRACEDGQLVYGGLEMPLGPEEYVLQAYLDQLPSVDQIKDVTPALDLAFRLETFQRAEAAKARAELQKRLQEEEAQRQKEAKRREIAEKIGSAAGRREMALVDFGEAARTSLLVGDATYLDHRKAARKDEMVVRFRLDGRRYECVCHAMTLRVIDSGVCLTDHVTNRKDDALLTLESLPSVLREAIDLGKLVVYRHVD